MKLLNIAEVFTLEVINWKSKFGNRYKLTMSACLLFPVRQAQVNIYEWEAVQVVKLLQNLGYFQLCQILDLT